ncbi:MAG: C1 family peptidase [Myxococcales bacterium]|nr:C1 family peptidase [Myxococcales bacterium]
MSSRRAFCLSWAFAVGCSCEGPASDWEHPMGTVQIVSDEVLDDLRQQGELLDVPDVTPEEERARIAQLEAAATAEIESFLVDHPQWRERLLWEVEATDATLLHDGNLEIELQPGSVVQLQGQGLRRRSLAALLRRLQEPEAHLELIEQLLVVVPERCRSLAADEGDRRRMSVEELGALTESVGRCWDDWRTLVGAFDDELPRGQQRSDTAGLEAPKHCEVVDEVCLCKGNPVIVGDGFDGAGSCAPSDPMVRDWVFTDHLSAVRSQGSRGTCVSFATAAALEYGLSRYDGLKVDVSEQYLYSLGKFDLYDDHFGDGLPTAEFLQDLAATGLGTTIEPHWGYNPSRCRIEIGAIGTYLHSCAGYAFDASPRPCSQTSHQLGLVAQAGSDPFFFRPSKEDERIEVTDALPLWNWFGPTLDSVNVFVEAGYGVVASIDVTQDFRDLYDFPDGFMHTSNGKVSGSHAVQVVRWVPDDTAPGGGWVVIKNSWGCYWGDSGYAYLSADWFRDNVNSVTAIRAQADVNTPPEISVVSPSTLIIDGLAPLGNEYTFEVAVSDAQDGATCCDVSWWSEDTGALLGDAPVLTHRFTSPGVHVLRATARDSQGGLAETSVQVLLTNSAPTVDIVRPAAPHARQTRDVWGLRLPVDTEITVSSVASDEEQLAVDCEERTWALDGQPVAQGADPCAPRIALTQPGWAQLTVVARDNDGFEGHDDRWLRGVELDSGDLPFVWINSPRHDEPLTEGVSVELEVATASGRRENVDVVWTLVRGDEEEEIGAGRAATWVADDSFHGAILRVQGSDSNGTSTDEIRLSVLSIPE